MNHSTDGRRVLFVTHEDIERTAVAKAMLQDVAHRLADQGFVCQILAAGSANESTQVERLRLHLFQRSSFGEANASAVLSLVKALPRFWSLLGETDVVYFRSYPSMLLFGLLARLRKRRVIFDTRGLFFEELVDSGKMKVRAVMPLLRFLEKRMLMLSDKVICVTRAQMDYYRALAPGVAGRCIVVPNGAPGSPVHSDRSGGDRYALVYVGSLVAWHSPGLMLSVCESLVEYGLDFTLDVLTRDEDFARSHFAKLGNKLTVFSHDYRALPIRYDLGFCLITGGLSKSVCFPVKLAEYLNSGTPVLASSNVAVCVEVIEKYDCGKLVSPTDGPSTIAKGIRDYLLESRVGRQAIKLPEELSFDAQVRTIEKIIVSG